MRSGIVTVSQSRLYIGTRSATLLTTNAKQWYQGKTQVVGDMYRAWLALIPAFPPVARMFLPFEPLIFVGGLEGWAGLSTRNVLEQKVTSVVPAWLCPSSLQEPQASIATLQFLFPHFPVTNMTRKWVMAILFNRGRKHLWGCSPSWSESMFPRKCSGSSEEGCSKNYWAYSCPISLTPSLWSRLGPTCSQNQATYSLFSTLPGLQNYNCSDLWVWDTILISSGLSWDWPTRCM